MKLLPFNLEEALKDPARVVYRNGEKPLEWHYFKSFKSLYQIHSVNQDGNLRTHIINGYECQDTSPSIHDLFLLPLPEKTYWVNVYENDVSDPYLFTGISVYECEEDAIAMIDKDLMYVKTISFTV